MKGLLCVGALLWACVGVCAAQDAVRILYCANRDVFEISSFEDGLPKLDKRLGAGAFDWADREHGDWKVLGDLPLDVEYAWAPTDYEIKRGGRVYGDAPSEVTIEARVNWQFLNETPWKKIDVSKDRFLVGWWTGQELVEVALLNQDLEKRIEGDLTFEISEEAMSGHVKVWLLEGGSVPAKKVEVDVVDIAANGVDLESKYGVKGTSAFKKERKGEVLLAAAANGHLPTVRWLIEACGFDSSLKNERESTALHSAAKNGRLEVVRYLIEKGAKLSIENFLKGYPLNYAAENGHFDCIKLLAREKPRSRKERFQFSRALNACFKGGYEEGALYLLSIGTTYSLDKSQKGVFVLSLFSTKMPRFAEAIALENKVAWDYADKGYGIMHAVAAYADPPLIEALVEKGVPAFGKTDKGIRPLDVAVGFGMWRRFAGFSTMRLRR